MRLACSREARSSWLSVLQESISELERAIRLNPRFTHQYLQFLGLSHFLMGKYETAAMMFRERLVLVKNTDIGRAWLASTLGHIGDTGGAKKTWEELRQINPDFAFEARLAFTDPSCVGKVMEGISKAGLAD